MSHATCRSTAGWRVVRSRRDRAGGRVVAEGRRSRSTSRARRVSTSACRRRAPRSGRPSGSARTARPERGTPVRAGHGAEATGRTRARVPRAGARPGNRRGRAPRQLAPERGPVRFSGILAAAGRRPRERREVEMDEERAPGRVDDEAADSVAPGLHGTSTRSARNQCSRSAYGTAAFAGEVDGSTNSIVSPSRRSCSPWSARSRNAPRYASLPTNAIQCGAARPRIPLKPLGGAHEVAGPQVARARGRARRGVRQADPPPQHLELLGG